MAELRRRTRALRFAAVVAGLAVVAGSATQVVITMSAPDAVRTATQNVSTANYFPAPLPTNLTCTTSGSVGFQRANLSWTAPPRPAGAAPYRYRVTWSHEATTPKYTFDTANTTTGEFRIGDEVFGGVTASTFRIYVQTINPDDTRVVSSGSVSWPVYSASLYTTRCTGDTGFRVDNQPWENQMEWTPGATGASPRAGRMFISMADELDSGALAETLPAQEDPGTLTDVPPPQVSPDASEASDPATSSDADAGPDAGESSTPPEPDDPTAGSGAAPGNEAAPGDDAAPGDAAEPAPSGPAVPPDEEPGGPGDPTDPPRATAALGAGPITVGAVEARLEDVDGQPEVILSSGDVEICTAAVPGATAIENSGGALIVTGAVPDRVVDTATCELS